MDITAIFHDVLLQRLMFSFLFGSMIGLERQLRHKMSGMVTNVLVAVGATLFMFFAHKFSADATARMGAQVISGIGFLGGGVIIRDGFSVRGINTAATLWCSAAIGLLCSEGHIEYAFAGTLTILAANILLKPIAVRLEHSSFGNKDVDFQYKIKLRIRHDQEQAITESLRKIIAFHNMVITGMESRNTENSEELELKIYMLVYGENDSKVGEVIDKIKAEYKIYNYSYEREIH